MSLVLVVDDEPMIRDLIAAVLEDTGYTVMTVESGRRLLDLLGSTVPDLVMMDVMMPDGGGRETFEAMQAADHLRAIPVILMSAAVAPQTLDQRITGFLAKPFDLTVLLAHVAHVVSPDVLSP